MVAESLESAYRRHAVELIRYATVMVGRDDATDVVIDAIVGVFGGHVDGDAIVNVRALLFRAVHNRAVDHHRATTRRRSREALFEGRRDVSVPAGPAVDARAALAVLSLQQRTVVFLAYWCDLGVGDIAVVLGVSEGTVRKQLARARARLREVLE
ncbi:MAG TPA: sigma-70 family RNA polymerase sigma factor [Ilumatobacteraceae bacterium]|nr:sigma-70 family RNA polymerase sigma factor [Ilumatobacteraceae bacterium]